MTNRRLLLGCGIILPILYIATDLAAATIFYPGYDYTAQQVSELSAIGAPSRQFWIAMTYAQALLWLGFAGGIWLEAGTRSGLRVAAVLIAITGAIGLLWVLFAPMHMRGTQFTATDSWHIGFTIATVVLILAYIGLGAAALGRAFRIYSALTVAAVLAAGATVGTQVAAIAAGEPTPWMGLVERVAVYGPTVWLGLFALMLLRDDRRRADVRAAAAP